MALDDAQIQWLETAQAKSADFAAFGETMRLKNAELDKITDQIALLQDELRRASDELKVTWGEDGSRKFWQKNKKQMDWKNGDRDSEIDTVHDLTGDYRVDPEKVKKVQKLHEELVKLQTRMEEAKGPDGEPLFTAKDIERELWSPLIQADVIPSNAVADKYSQEAQVWNGACEIYQEKLKEYTETASKYDQVQRGLRIGGDVVSVVGSMAAESIKAANFDGLSITKAETDRKEKLEGIDKSLWSKDDAKFMEGMPAREQQALNAARDLQALNTATTVINGTIGIVSNALDKKDPKKGWQIAEKVFTLLASTASASMTMVEKQVGATDPTRAETPEFKTMIASATSLIDYGLKAGKVVFRVADIVNATDEAGQKSAAMGLVTCIAGAVGSAFAAFDTEDGTAKDGTEITGTGGQWAKIGQAINMGMVGSANIGFIVDHCRKMAQAGKPLNLGALVGAMGVTVIAPMFTALYKSIAGSTNKDDSTDTGPVVVDKTSKQVRDGDSEDNDLTGETIATNTDLMSSAMDTLLDPSSTDNESIKEDMDKAMDRKAMEEAIAKALKTVDLTKLSPDMLKSVPKDGDGNDKKRAIAERLAKMEAEEKEAAISDFKKKLSRDETAKEEFFKTIKTASDEEAKRIDDLIGEASGGPEDMEDEERAKKAMDSVDKLIREAAACNSRWQMLDTMTSAGVSILVAALPVAGLAAAIQKLAMDVIALTRKSVQLNKWVDNMALTAGNNSVYGPAIQSRLSSAKVQVSQAATRVIFDAIGVAAEGAKLADCMGVATGLSIGNSMARALTEFGFKMHKEAEIEAGWQLYKDARASPGDRKKARKAMRWNSTLSKCVLAYGIVKDGDPIAKEVGRSCGLSPEILADQSDVCGKVVTYFQTLYSDDPVVMRRVPLTKDWHPGAPVLTLDSWMRFKAAAVDRAVPPMAEASARTSTIDAAFAKLGALIGTDGNYSKRRDAQFPEMDVTDPKSEDKRAKPEYRKYLQDTVAAAETLVGALRGWTPVNGPEDKAAKVKWIEGLRHDNMIDVAESLIAQAQFLSGEVAFDLKALDAREKAIADRKKEQEDAAKKLAGQDQDEDDGTTGTKKKTK
jgi:hypothetical protein